MSSPGAWRRLHAMRRPLVLALALVAAFQIVACGGGGSGSSTTTTATTSHTTTTVTTATGSTQTAPQGGIDPMTGASTKPVHAAAKNKHTALLTNVRAARHEGFDRVVFAFRNALPGYDVRYVTGPVHQDGSGKVVPISGGFVVQIRMQNALDADLSQSSAPRTYTGPQRFTPGLPEVAELARAGGFEGVLTWIAGLRDRVDFRVTTLAAPPRLVVDFRNH